MNLNYDELNCVRTSLKQFIDHGAQYLDCDEIAPQRRSELHSQAVTTLKKLNSRRSDFDGNDLHIMVTSLSLSCVIIEESTKPPFMPQPNHLEKLEYLESLIDSLEEFAGVEDGSAYHR